MTTITQDIDMDTSETAWQAQIDRLANESLRKTSSMEEFDRIAAFIDRHPGSCAWFPNKVFNTLFLHCTVGCVCTRPKCPKNHKRHWRSNARFLAEKGKLCFVAECRIIMVDPSKQPLGLKEAALAIVPMVSSAAANVRSIVVVGNGMTQAGQLQTPKQRYAEAEDTVKAIRQAFPNATSLKHHHSGDIDENPLSPADIPEAVSELWYLLTDNYLPQLEHADLFAYLPPESLGFCQNLTTLRLNSEYTLMNPDSPRIPTRKLRKLELYRIRGAFPWRLFKMSKGVVDLSGLASLAMEFIRTFDEQASFPGEGNDIIFGSLQTLKICGSGFAYLDLYAFFLDNPITELDITEDPVHYGCIDFRIIESIRKLRVGHPNGYPQVSKYSVAAIEPLFESLSVAEEAAIDSLLFPVPEIIQWVNLRSLHLLVSIADTACMASLLCQLPSLQELSVVSYSMDRGDAEDMMFVDQSVSFENVDEMVDPDGTFPINESLSKLSIYAYTEFDSFGLYCLVCRLPNVVRLGVNYQFVAKMDVLLSYFDKVDRYVTVHPSIGKQ